MSDMSDRLRKARIMAGYKTATAATDAHGWVYSTYACHENGSREFPHEAQHYAQAFRVSLNWLMTGLGDPKGRGQDPILKLFEAIPPERRAQAIEFLQFLGSKP